MPPPRSQSRGATLGRGSLARGGRGRGAISPTQARGASAAASPSSPLAAAGTGGEQQQHPVAMGSADDSVDPVLLAVAQVLVAPPVREKRVRPRLEAYISLSDHQRAPNPGMASVARLIDSQLQWDTASSIHWLKNLAFTSSEVPPEGRLAGANQMLDELNSAAAAADAAAAGKAAEKQRREATAQATAQARVATKATEDARKAEVAAAKVRKLEDKARETEARKATRAARDEAAAAAEPAPGRVKEYRRINLFGGPLGVDETEDSGPTTMPRSVKVSLCKKAIQFLHGARRSYIHQFFRNTRAHRGFTRDKHEADSSLPTAPVF